MSRLKKFLDTKKEHVLALKISGEMKTALSELSEKQGMKQPNLIRIALAEYIIKEENKLKKNRTS